MTAGELCEQLARAPTATERERALSAAAAAPECLHFALERARDLTPQTPLAALDFADLAVEVAGRRAESANVGAALRVRGQALRVLGRHAEAVQSFTAASARAHEAGDPALGAQFLIGSIDSLAMLGRYREAIRLSRQVTGELRKAGAEIQAARALCNEGSVQFRRDRLTEALDCYERADHALQSGGDEVMRAAVWMNRANVLTQLGRFEEAIGLYRDAEAAYSGSERAIEAAVVETNLGYLELISGRPAMALSLYRRAAEAFAASDRSQDSARCDLGTAEAYRALNLYPEALEAAGRALRVSQELDLAYEAGRAHLILAAALTGLGQEPEALGALDSAATAFERQQNRVQHAQVELTRSALLAARGDRAGAVRAAQLAAPVLLRAGLAGWAAEARFVSAEWDLRQGVNAVRRMLRIRDAARRTRRVSLESRSERAIGSFYAEAGRVGLALRHYRAAIDALERLRNQIAPERMHVAFLRDKQTVYEEFAGLLLSRGRESDLAEAFECVERSRSQLLLERLQDTLVEGPRRHAPPGLIDRIQRLRGELSRAQYREQSPVDAKARRFHLNCKQLNEIERAYERALHDLELHSTPVAMQHPGAVSIEHLQGKLGPSEVLLEFAETKEGYCAFTLSRSELKVHRRLADAGTVRQMVRRLRYHLQKMELAEILPDAVRTALQADVLSVLAGLYRLLVQPLEPALRHAEQLVVVPHGPLHGVPFHALFDGEAYAGDRWEILHSPSATVWTRQLDHHPHHGLGPPLLMAVPAAGIEGVSDEVTAIGKCLPGSRTYLGAEADLSRFYSDAPAARVLHLATHAQFRPDNALFSGLRLSEGWLLARDLYDLRLNCRLATLSACETGVATIEPGDELFGLIRGFLAAGARSVAASLWPAHDAATVALMREFYGRLAAGATCASSLQAAQRQLRRSYPHPYHWAPFIIVGAR